MMHMPFKRCWRSLLIFGVLIGIGFSLQLTQPTVATASRKPQTQALSLKETVYLLNRNKLFQVHPQLHLTKRGKLANNFGYGVATKRTKKGWKIYYVATSGGYRCNITATPLKGNRKVKFTLFNHYAYTAATDTHHHTVARHPKKSPWHRGLPAALRHKKACTNVLGHGNQRRHYFFNFGKASLGEGLFQAGDTASTKLTYKKVKKGYDVKAKINDFGKYVTYTYHFRMHGCNKFTAKSYAAKRAVTYHFVKKLPLI